MPGTVQELASTFREAIDSQGNVSPPQGDKQGLSRSVAAVCGWGTHVLSPARHFVLPPCRFSTWASFRKLCWHWSAPQ